MNKENNIIYDEKTGEDICAGCGNLIDECDCDEEDFSEAS